MHQSTTKVLSDSPGLLKEPVGLVCINMSCLTGKQHLPRKSKFKDGPYNYCLCLACYCKCPYRWDLLLIFYLVLGTQDSLCG